MLNQGKECSIPACLDDLDRMKFHLKVTYTTPGKAELILAYGMSSLDPAHPFIFGIDMNNNS